VIAARFTGADYYYLTDGPQFAWSNVLTFAAWLRIDADPVVGMSYCANIFSDLQTGPSYTLDFRFGDGTAGNVRKFCIQPNFSSNVLDPVDFPFGRWAHFAASCDGTNARFYHDGMLVGSAAYSSTPTSNPNDFRIGMSNGYGGGLRPFIGGMQWLGIWNGRALSHAEVIEHMRGRIPYRPTLLVDFSSLAKPLDLSKTRQHIQVSSPMPNGTEFPDSLLGLTTPGLSFGYADTRTVRGATAQMITIPGRS
jgi:hypothetical protein